MLIFSSFASKVVDVLLSLLVHRAREATDLLADVPVLALDLLVIMVAFVTVLDDEVILACANARFVAVVVVVALDLVYLAMVLIVLAIVVFGDTRLVVLFADQLAVDCLPGGSVVRDIRVDRFVDLYSGMLVFVLRSEILQDEVSRAIIEFFFDDVKTMAKSLFLS